MHSHNIDPLITTAAGCGTLHMQFQKAIAIEVRNPNIINFSIESPTLETLYLNSLPQIN